MTAPLESAGAMTRAALFATQLIIHIKPLNIYNSSIIIDRILSGRLNGAAQAKRVCCGDKKNCVLPRWQSSRRQYWHSSSRAQISRKSTNKYTVCPAIVRGGAASTFIYIFGVLEQILGHAGIFYSFIFLLLPPRNRSNIDRRLRVQKLAQITILKLVNIT